jgi:hypothetical protein
MVNIDSDVAKGQLRIPLEQLPKEILDELSSNPSQSPVLNIKLEDVFAPNGFNIELSWESSYIEFDFRALKLEVVLRD